MKILPFTLFILILFGIISISSFQRACDRAQIYSALQSHMEVAREMDNSYQERIFYLKCFARKKRAKSSGSKKPTTSRGTGKPKKRTVRPFAYKINFALALEEEGVHHDIARELLKNDELLAQLTKAARNQTLERTEDLAALQFELRPVWLKLLREGLLDHITVHPDDDRRIYVAYASKKLLDILFDDPESILEEAEQLKEKWLDSKKNADIANDQFQKKLKTFCESHGPRFQNLCYDITYKPKEITLKGKKKQISLERRRLTSPVL